MRAVEHKDARFTRWSPGPRSDGPAHPREKNKPGLTSFGSVLRTLFSLPRTTVVELMLRARTPPSSWTSEHGPVESGKLERPTWWVSEASGKVTSGDGSGGYDMLSEG
jgi:hypothetical protein